MVKNLGGNKAKGFARKHTNGGKKATILRTAEEEGEIYAVVTKICGNSMFECTGIDRIDRLGHIRGKFSGKGKRDNIVQNGVWVLVGVREWDIKKEEQKHAQDKGSKKEKLPQCDLLEVYNDNDKERLRNEVVANWRILVKNDPTRIVDYVDDGNDDDDEFTEEFGFKFATAHDIERDALLKEAKLATSEKIIMSTKDEVTVAEQMVSIDDI